MRTPCCLVLIALVFAFPASAGEPHACPAETQRCLNDMASKLKRRGWVGIEMDLNGKQVVVTRVVDESPAKAAGLVAGDVLVSANGVALTDDAKVTQVTETFAPGKTVDYVVLRKGAEQRLTVKLGELPQHILWTWIGMHMLEQHARPVAPRPPKN